MLRKFVGTPTTIREETPKSHHPPIPGRWIVSFYHLTPRLSGKIKKKLYFIEIEGSLRGGFTMVIGLLGVTRNSIFGKGDQRSRSKDV